WHAVTLHQRGLPYEADVWELYNQNEDVNEIHDLAAARPDKLAELKADWLEAARRHDVLPLDDRNFVVKLLTSRAREAPRAHWEVRPPIKRIAGSAAPQLAGASH